MSNNILKATNISKQYRLGLVGTGTLTHDLNRWWHKLRGKQDPYLKIGTKNDRSKTSSEDYVWALEDINFEVKQGEVLGIIGKNGAGKSTLLKILSRVTLPTTGSIKTKGRIASLLEVGTGFHPELTGRENIYLNGAILGMTKAEIKSKEAEIIDFSGCALYIDTPVKRYSSGMRVRLAFAVAAHLEPDILVVDEVLAVGDAEFQKKAVGKMKAISGESGRTVLFVSHNMAAVKSLCTRAMVLEQGKMAFEGGTTECIEFYLANNKIKTKYNFTNKDNGIVESVTISNENNTELILLGHKMLFNVKLRENIENRRIDIGVYDSNEIKILNLSTSYSINSLNGKNLKCEIPKISLNPGTYHINLAILKNNEVQEFYENCLNIEILNGDFFNNGKLIEKIPCKYFIEHNWK